SICAHNPAYVIVRVPGHSAQPVFNAVRSCRALGPCPRPFALGQALRERRVRHDDGAERCDRGFDLSVEVQAWSVLFLVDRRKGGVVLSDDAAEPDAFDQLSIGDVVDYLAGSPGITLAAVKFLRRN